MFGKKNGDGEKPEKRASFFNRRSFRYGSTATIFTVVVIAVVILVNVVVTALSGRLPISIDLTSSKNYELTSQSVNYIKKVKANITITILADEGSFVQDSTYGPVYRVIKQYPEHNSRISITFKNIEKNDPTYASRYPNETFADGDIMVTNGSHYKHLTSSDLLETSTDSETGETTATGDTAEQSIDQAIEYVTSQDLPEVAFASGNGEEDSSALQSLLEKNNYKVETRDLDTQGPDDAADALAIVAPKNDFTSAEITKIDNFLSNGKKYGKNLLVFFDPQQSTLPTFEGYLKQWGFSVSSGALYDATNNYGAYFDIVEGTTDSTYVGTLSTDNHADLENTRPVNLLFTTKGTYTTDAVVQTMDTSRLWNPSVINSSSVSSFKPASSDKAGPFNALAVSTDAETYNNSEVKSNVLVSGSYEFVNSTLLQTPNLENATIILNTVNKLVGTKSQLDITPKDMTAQTLTITANQSKAIEVIFIFLVPLAVVVAGMIVWLRRRHQ